MLCIKKRDTKQVFKAIAHQQGVSVSEVKERIQSTIDEMYYSDDQMCKLNFQVILERNDLHQKNTFIRWQQKLNTDFMKIITSLTCTLTVQVFFLSFFIELNNFFLSHRLIY